tara:strand:- start:3643 stop:4956 length:1314 start_codon:yes stop_codon:yes gene_type:complete
MASTYTTNFGIEKIGSGDQSGSWGTTTNFNLDILDRVASFKAVALTGTTHTLTVREASPDSGTENLQDGMFRVIKFTGALGANNTVTVAPNTTTAYFIFVNSTTDSGSSGPYSVVIKQGSGAEITIPNGHSSVVFCDGAGSGAAVTDAFAKLYVSDAIQIGSGAAEDTKIVFDGNAQDFYVGLDDSADDLIIGSGSAVGTNPAIAVDENQLVTFPAAAVTIGDGTAEDTKLVYDGNAKDFYVGLDDSADKLVIGVGSTVGTNPIITLDDDSVVIGDGDAVDTKVVFDGNAQDFYIGLDDSADDLVFGQGSTVGTNVAFAIDENQVTQFSHAAVGSTQTASISGNTTLDFQTYQNFVLTFTGNVTLDNPTTEAVGQSGFIFVIQDGTGSRTLALGTDYETVGGAGLTISTTASAVDLIPYVVKASGSIQLGTAQLAFA